MAQALTLGNDFFREHSLALGVSALAHVALLVLLVLNLRLLPLREPQPVRLAIQATVVDERPMREKVAAQARVERELREAAAAAARRQEEERQRQVEEREALAEQKKEDAAAQARAERERQEATAAAARRQEAEKQRLDAQRAQQQKALEAQAAADAKRKAESEKKLAQSKADLARQLAEEEKLAAAEDSGLLDQYAEVIRQKVERNWIRPASAKEGVSCTVLVKQIPGGDVVDVRVSECNGDAALVRSIEAAVLRSSPLPPPPDPALFDRSLRFEFRPRD